MNLIVGVDSQFVHATLKKSDRGTRFPYRGLVDFLERDDQVIELFAPVIRFPPETSSPADFAKANTNYFAFSTALQSQGVNVIEAPAKRAGDGVKHSDDQRLMIRLALTCMRLKPDFLVLLAADGDYAPLVWGLREEGIRTKLITDINSLAPELRMAAYSVSDIMNVLKQIDMADGPMTAQDDYDGHEDYPD